MINNKENEKVAKDYVAYLHALKYSETVCRVCVLGKFRLFTRDKNFKEVHINDLRNFFAYLKIENKLSDVYLSSLGTELRRFFKYLKIKGINDNLMYSLVIPAHRKHEPHMPFEILHARYNKFHPRAINCK